MSRLEQGKGSKKSMAPKVPKSSPRPVGAQTRRQSKRVPNGVSDQERYSMIAHAAYLRAAARDFAPGNELDDWLAAEAEIETRLASR